MKSASNLYFQKSASQLTLCEGATLAAILKYPTRYDPVLNPDNSFQRRNTVLTRMFELGYLSADEYDSSVNEPLTLALSRDGNRAEAHSWFTDTLTEDIINDLMSKYGMSRSTASATVFSGGLDIYTTVKPEIQHVMESYFADNSNFPRNASGIPQSCSVIINPKNGAVLGIVGSCGVKSSDRILNLATQMKRSPGSVIKPVSVYAPTVEENIITWSSVFDDVPTSFIQDGEGSFSAWPKNNPRVYSGLKNVGRALCESTNTVAVRVLDKLGIEKSFDFSERCGISLCRSVTKNGKSFTDMDIAPLALGATSLGVSLREMTGAYTVFADDGTFHSPITYYEVRDRSGNVILENKTKGERLLSPDTADIMTKLLTNVVTHGTADCVRLNCGDPVAGKTGTSNANTDRWFIGYTPEYVCGVWYGFKDARDIGYYKNNPACTVFDGLTEAVYKIIPPADFDFETSGNVVRCLFCRDSGKKLCAECSADLRGSRADVGYFKKGTEPSAACDRHIFVDYDKVTRAVACEHCPKENIIKVSLVKNEDRAFPVQLTVTDAQYTYRSIPPDRHSDERAAVAFFQSLEGENSFFGISVKSGNAANRYCTEHMPENGEERVKAEQPRKRAREDSAFFSAISRASSRRYPRFSRIRQIGRKGIP